MSLFQSSHTPSLDYFHSIGVADIFHSEEEAKMFMGDPTINRSWKEYYSSKNRRFYYCNNENDANSWDYPLPLLAEEWVLDSQIYGVPISLSRSVSLLLHEMMDDNWFKPNEIWNCLGVIGRLLRNVADCANTVEKYRTVRLGNPKISEMVQAIPQSIRLLEASGFRIVCTPSSLPSSIPLSSPSTYVAEERVLRLAANADLNGIHLIAARVSCLDSLKGFTGKAIYVKEKSLEEEAIAAIGGPTSITTSKYAGTTGFRYQRRVYECGACRRPINDGSDRAATGKFDAPRGEIRYECTTCLSGGQYTHNIMDAGNRLSTGTCRDENSSQNENSGNNGNRYEGSGNKDRMFNLCETCFERHVSTSNEPLHEVTHRFEPRNPVSTRYGLYVQNQEIDADAMSHNRNPWGTSSVPLPSRALKRLYDRHGY